MKKFLRKRASVRIFGNIWQKCVPILYRRKLEYVLADAGIIDRGDLQVLDRIEHELDNYLSTRKTHNKLRVLYGPSFSIYDPCFVHDRIFSCALRVRGIEIIPIYCDAVQQTECNVFGGVWGGDNFQKNCLHCIYKSEELWSNQPIHPLKLSKYFHEADFDEIEKIIKNLDGDLWAHYTEAEYLFGSWAKDILVNNYVVGDYHLIPGHENLGKAHLRNLLVLKKCYERIIDEKKPDRVITNDSFYGMWATLQILCKHKGIPFYSHWSGTRPGGWCYAYNDASMNLDFSKPWPRFSRIPMTDTQKGKVRAWLQERTRGEGFLLNTATPTADSGEYFEVSKIDSGKPTSLLPANVIWDLAGLNKQIIFDDMIDWIAQTIMWFAQHPQYQLIIKPHPAEMHSSLPETKETIAIGLSLRGIQIPSNVYLLHPKINVSVYQLFPYTQIGLVHTSTTGVEMAGVGIPVITTARAPYRGFGFTSDPINREDYFRVLEKSLNNERLIELETQLDLSWKYILFNFFHYYSRLDIMDYEFGKVNKLNVKSLYDILPGKNHFLDYVVDSITLGMPIVSDERWPPES